MKTTKQQMFEDLARRLGDGLVDVELDAVHYETAFRYALMNYRQRASNATTEVYAELTLVQDQDVYKLPDEFINVRQLIRRGAGLTNSNNTGGSFDAFAASTLNTYVLLAQGPGGLSQYELYAGYVELTQKMFGAHLMFKFDPSTKELRIVRHIKASGEKIIIWGDIQRKDTDLLIDPYVGIWLADWTLSELKMILGEAREKFSGGLAGVSGGVQLNGSQLKTEAKEMQTRLLEELKNLTDNSAPLTWITG